MKNPANHLLIQWKYGSSLYQLYLSVAASYPDNKKSRQKVIYDWNNDPWKDFYTYTYFGATCSRARTLSCSKIYKKTNSGLDQKFLPPLLRFSDFFFVFFSHFYVFQLFLARIPSEYMWFHSFRSHQYNNKHFFLNPTFRETEFSLLFSNFFS